MFFKNLPAFKFLTLHAEESPNVVPEDQTTDSESSRGSAVDSQDTERGNERFLAYLHRTAVTIQTGLRTGIR